MYKFEVMLGDIFIRYIEASDYTLKNAYSKASKELQSIYPETYTTLNLTLCHRNEVRGVKSVYYYGIRSN